MNRYVDTGLSIVLLVALSACQNQPMPLYTPTGRYQVATRAHNEVAMGQQGLVRNYTTSLLVSDQWVQVDAQGYPVANSTLVFEEHGPQRTHFMMRACLPQLEGPCHAVHLSGDILPQPDAHGYMVGYVQVPSRCSENYIYLGFSAKQLDLAQTDNEQPDTATQSEREEFDPDQHALTMLVSGNCVAPMPGEIGPTGQRFLFFKRRSSLS